MADSFQTTDPATGATLQKFKHLSSAQIETILSEAHSEYLKAKTKTVP